MQLGITNSTDYNVYLSLTERLPEDCKIDRLISAIELRQCPRQALVESMQFKNEAGSRTQHDRRCCRVHRGNRGGRVECVRAITADNRDVDVEEVEQVLVADLKRTGSSEQGAENGPELVHETASALARRMQQANMSGFAMTPGLRKQPTDNCYRFLGDLLRKVLDTWMSGKPQGRHLSRDDPRGPHPKFWKTSSANPS